MPILLSLSKMQILGMTLELDPKGAKITCPAFGLYSSPAEYSTMGHIMLDLTILAYQPKSRERSARPTKHVTFALSQKKSANPAHSQELDDDEDDKPLVRPDGTIVSEEDENDKLLVQLTSVLNRESSEKRGVPLPVQSRKGPPVWQDPSATLEQDVSGTSRELSGDISSLGEHSHGEALQQVINRLSDVRNLKGLYLKYYFKSSAQFKKRTTHLGLLVKVYDLYQHVVKTCPFYNSTKPRPDRSQVSGLLAEEVGPLSSWIMVLQKLETDFWIFGIFV